MNAKLAEIALKRERLIAQAARQRTAVAQAAQAWRGPLALADRGLVALRYLKQHPLWVVGGVAVVVALRPRGVMKWLGRGLAAYKIGRGLRAWWR
jgi:hypothetical protein